MKKPHFLFLFIVLLFTSCAHPIYTIPLSTEQRTQFEDPDKIQTYEYPDATVHIFKSHHNDPAVNNNEPSTLESNTEIESHLYFLPDNIAKGNIRYTKTIKVCLPETDQCDILFEQAIILPRPKPIRINKKLPSTFTHREYISKNTIIMLQSTRSTLKLLLSKMAETLISQPQTGNCDTQSNFQGNYPGIVLQPSSLRMTQYFQQNGYLNLHDIVRTSQLLEEYIKARNGCYPKEKSEEIFARIQPIKERKSYSFFNPRKFMLYLYKSTIPNSHLFAILKTAPPTISPSPFSLTASYPNAKKSSTSSQHSPKIPIYYHHQHQPHSTNFLL